MDTGDMAVLAALGGFVLILFVILIAFYLVDAIARFKYLKVRSYENAWMAFIPIVNIWASVEATYGPVDTINLYGWNAPAVIMKLWAVVTYVLSLVINRIPYVGGVLSMVLTVLSVAVMFQLYKDMMERLNDPQTTGSALVAVIISIVGSIKILSASGKHAPGEQNWQTDARVLESQTRVDGPLSFLNGGGSSNNQNMQ